MDDLHYEVGTEYIDKANPNISSDQFSRWFKESIGKSISTMGGMRPLKKKDGSALAFLILVSNSRGKPSGLENPWEDHLDLYNGTLTYLGDAKKSTNHIRPENYSGNKCLLLIQESILMNDLQKVPPILYFRKERIGKTTFYGLLVLEKVEKIRFEQQGHPIPNYKFNLSLLNVDFISLKWLKQRYLSEPETFAPNAWKNYVENGKIENYFCEKNRIINKEDQLPTDINNLKLLNDFVSFYSSREFELLIPELMKLLNKNMEIITTRITRDGGFDFYGNYPIPELNHKLPFKGEVKLWKTTSRIGVKEVCRLIARLERGEFGIFVTTSYFSKQAQEEILRDKVPVKLIDGKQLYSLLRMMGWISKSNEFDRVKISEVLNIKKE